MAIIQNFLEEKKEKKRGGLFSRAAEIVDKYSPVGVLSNLFVEPLVKTAAKPLGEAISASYELLGKKAPAWTKNNRMASPELIATLKGGDIQEIKQNIETLKRKGYEGAGFTDVLNALSVVPGGALLKSVGITKGGIFSKAAQISKNVGQRRLTGGVASNAWKTAKEIAPASAAWGGAYGVASGVDEDTSLFEAGARGVAGAGIGALTAGAFAVGGSGVGALLRTKPQKDIVKINKIIDSNKKGLNSLTKRYTKLFDIVENAKKKNVDILDELAKSDILLGAVDEDGYITTKGKANAYGKIQSKIDGVDDVILRNIERDDIRVPLGTMEEYLVNSLNDSGFVLGKRKKAIQKINSELREASKQAIDGKVPLALAQKGKIQIKADYLNPEKDDINKLIKKAYQKLVEDKNIGIDSQKVNKELGELLMMREFIKNLHNKRIKGGRLGKYFAQGIGAVAGGKLGVAGSIAGAEAAGRLHGSMLAGTFGKKTGGKINIGKTLTEAAYRGRTPAYRLRLPSPPKGGTSTINNGLPLPMHSPTQYEKPAKIIGNSSRKLTLEDIDSGDFLDPNAAFSKNVLDDSIKDFIANTKTYEEFDSELERRIEKFREEAGLMAEREGAGVKYRDVYDAAGNFDFQAKSFSLKKAKAVMHKQAESLKKYAQNLLYENDKNFRALVDARDDIRERTIIDITTIDFDDPLLFLTPDEIKMRANTPQLNKEITEIESVLSDREYIEASKFYGQQSQGRVMRSKMEGIDNTGRYSANLYKQTPDENRALYTGEKVLSTKLLEKFRGEPEEITIQRFNEIINKAQKEGIKKVDLDMVREGAKEINGKINLTTLAENVAKQLVPLTPTPAKSPRYAHIGQDFIGDGRYGEIIYESPIKTSAGDVHFSSKEMPNYFSHVRYEDQGTTRKLMEVQSDLAQKGNLDRELPYKGFRNGENIKKTTAEVNFRVEKGIMTRKEADEFIEMEKKAYNKLMVRDEELKPLYNYESNDPLAHLRTFREEVKRAAKDGKDTLLVPTGETAMKIEGLGENAKWAYVTPRGGTAELTPQNLKVGQTVNQGDATGNFADSQDWIITDVLGDGKFKAVPKDVYEKYGNPANLKTAHQKAQRVSSMNSMSETFDISGKVDTKHFVYKLNEEAIPKEARKQGLIVEGKISQDNGEWWEIKIPKEKARMPVEAFIVPPLLFGVSYKYQENDKIQ